MENTATVENSTINKYAYPVQMNEKIRMTYDESPAHVAGLSQSVDFICEEGTPVFAALDGVVIETKSDSDIGGPGKELEEYGNYIEIEHTGGEFSEYEHLKKDGVLVKAGDKVKKGQLIGYSGATGWLAHLGPHLHFMVGNSLVSAEGYNTKKINWE